MFPATMHTLPGMTDLERLRAHPNPRPLGLCLRYALRHEGTSGYLGYGVLWAFIALPLAILPAVFLTPSLPALGFAAGVVLAFAPYVAWVYRRSAPGRRLVREGAIVDATIEAVTPRSGRSRGISDCTVTFRVGGHERTATGSVFTAGMGDLAVDSPSAVLYLEGDERCGIFVDGRLRMGFGDTSGLGASAVYRDGVAG